MNAVQQAYLDQYLSTLTPTEQLKSCKAIAEHYCADEYNANECARLISLGIKRASCSLKAGYEAENEPLPEVGLLTVVLNWKQEPVCIVKMTEVSICPFNQVTREFAESEGEGDGSYECWRAAHINFFSKYAQEVGVEFNETSNLVLERFVKVYPE
ncbi:ASCH domain-containing protein [Vibrio genomosp. F10 str. 9ZC157]|uniref:RNA-binding protein n=1 Tax=Vibrio genomosp. F10 str. ZF-129 TaxID=1187848 RepID=A0A1E5BIW1_9VIBR|nr:ASCH domain-containing protein [Vibrio genomosp. F10]OEE37440.1 RNA-binding protein [Vibrio genomosp. F10 str. ZF-129]OEE92920.1 RNA-binding protein [Vibrio genomosp. F10 str. 9ZC157]